MTDVGMIQRVVPFMIFAPGVFYYPLLVSFVGSTPVKGLPRFPSFRRFHISISLFPTTTYSSSPLIGRYKDSVDTCRRQKRIGKRCRRHSRGSRNFNTGLCLVNTQKPWRLVDCSVCRFGHMKRGNISRNTMEIKSELRSLKFYEGIHLLGLTL